MEYKTVYNSRNNFRFEITNPPPIGAELKTTDGEEIIFDGIGLGGMLECTRKSDGSQQLYFPHYLVVPNVQGEALPIEKGQTKL